jgi:hypothetical protein
MKSLYLKKMKCFIDGVLYTLVYGGASSEVVSRDDPSNSFIKNLLKKACSVHDWELSLIESGWNEYDEGWVIEALKAEGNYPESAGKVVCVNMTKPHKGVPNGCYDKNAKNIVDKFKKLL